VVEIYFSALSWLAQTAKRLLEESRNIYICKDLRIAIEINIPSQHRFFVFQIGVTVWKILQYFVKLNIESFKI
jgi:hypothetical protein